MVTSVTNTIYLSDILSGRIPTWSWWRRLTDTAIQAMIDDFTETCDDWHLLKIRQECERIMQGHGANPEWSNFALLYWYCDVSPQCVISRRCSRCGYGTYAHVIPAQKCLYAPTTYERLRYEP